MADAGEFECRLERTRPPPAPVTADESHVQPERARPTDFTVARDEATIRTQDQVKPSRTLGWPVQKVGALERGFDLEPVAGFRPEEAPDRGPCTDPNSRAACRPVRTLTSCSGDGPPKITPTSGKLEAPTLASARHHLCRPGAG